MVSYNLFIPTYNGVLVLPIYALSLAFYKYENISEFEFSICKNKGLSENKSGSDCHGNRITLEIKILRTQYYF